MKFVFVGDIALGDHPKTVGFGFYSKYKDKLPLNTSVFPADLDADIIFGNLEFGLSDQELLSNSVSGLQCRGITSFVKILNASGFNVINVANNHIYQHGFGPFSDTIEILKQNNIHVCGTSDDFLEDSCFSINGKFVAIIGFSARPRQGFSDTPPYNEFSEKQSFSRIKQVKKWAEVIIVSIHWGDEFISVPKNSEEKIAKKMIDSGANFVIGHHPHVLRPIEEYGDALIAYSLGNFICDMTWNSATSETGFLFAEVNEDNTKIFNWEFIPGIIGQDYFPRFISDERRVLWGYCLDNRFSSTRSKVRLSDYSKIAKNELFKHEMLTALFTILNFRKYKLSHFSQIMFGAILRRLKSCLPGRY